MELREVEFRFKINTFLIENFCEYFMSKIEKFLEKNYNLTRMEENS